MTQVLGTIALPELATDYTLRTVAVGSAALGLVSGALGVFAVLRRQSLLGDAVCHATLPGIVIAFLVTGSKAPLVLVAGAALTGWLASLLVLLIVRVSRIKLDSALGIVLSSFFGLGLVLLSIAQRHAGAGQAGLDRFIFGQAAALVGADLVTMAGLGTIVLAAVLLFWKEFKLLSFDAAFAGSLGLPVRWLEVALTSLLVLSIVTGLQTVGVVLMSAMIVAPATAARQWTDRLGHLVLLSGAFGALAGLVGALISSSVEHLPTGPTIVLAITTIALFSLLAAPRRGLVSTRLHAVRQRRRLQVDVVLADLYRLAAQHPEPETAPHATAVLRAMNERHGIGRSLRRLAESGLAREDADGRWRLTPEGVEAGRHLAESAGGSFPAGGDA